MINLRDFRIGWRFLKGEPIYSLVVIAGLALGFAACFLLLGYVRYAFSYDVQVPELNRVYQVKQRLDGEPTWEKGLQLPFAQVVRESGLAEQSSFAYVNDYVLRYQNRSREVNLTIVEPDFEKIFGVTAIEGDVSTSLNEPDAIALTSSTAQKIFGHLHALHQVVEIAGTSYRVTAILPDPPSNTNMPYEALAGSHTRVWTGIQRDDQIKNWNLLSCWIFIKLNRNGTPQQLEGVLQIANDRFSRYSHKSNVKSDWKPGDPAYANIKLDRLADVYFDESLQEHGNKLAVVGLALIALLILLIAATNYMNLAIVRTIRRQKEIGMHKALGASRMHIIRRFMSESVLVSSIATTVGILLAWLLLPWFAELMGHPLDNVFTFLNCAMALLIGLVIGLMTGAYPAWVAIHTNAKSSLSGRDNVEGRSGLWVRRILTVLQFAIAMGLAAVTITILWQTRYASNVNPGYDPTNLVVLEVSANFNDFDYPDSPDSMAKLAFPAKLATLPGVVGVTAALNPPGRDDFHMLYETKSITGMPLQLSTQIVTTNFFEIYQLKARAGRLFDSHIDAADNRLNVVLNWAAARSLGFTSPDDAIGRTMAGKDGLLTIIGIAPDIRHQNMRNESQPTIYRNYQFAPGATPWLTVRANGNVAEVEKEIEKIWPISFPTKTLNMRSAQQSIADNYADDLRYVRLLAASSGLAITIAAFGIYVLSAYSVQRRTREIVLRKLHGAGPRAIAQLVLYEFGWLLAISALIGLPSAFLASSRYLAEFVERAPMGGWPLLFAFILSFLVACCAMFRYVHIAMRLSPVAALAS